MRRVRGRLGEKGRAERAVLLELEEHAAPAIDSRRLLTPAREERAEDRRVVDASRLRGDLTSRKAQQPRVRFAGVAEDRAESEYTPRRASQLIAA